MWYIGDVTTCFILVAKYAILNIIRELTAKEELEIEKIKHKL
jgi:hypothetical protein